jgi:pimeloyl-ACP methyl ester carboxylesterase
MTPRTHHRGLIETPAGPPVFIDTGRIGPALAAGFEAPPAAPACVLLHGALNDHRAWRWQARALARAGVPVLAPDWPGHGLSAGPALPSVDAMADWLLGLLDALQVGPVILAGHSMGSLVALEAAARLGPRARGLVLVGTAAPMKVAPAMLELALNDPASAIGQIGQFSVAQPKPIDGEAPPLPGMLRRAQRIRQRLETMMRDNLAPGTAHGLLHTDLSACNEYAHALERAAELSCPTWLVSGSKDKMTPAKATTALQAALGKRLARVELLDGGHTLMAEQAQGVLQVLRLAIAAAQPGASA